MCHAVTIRFISADDDLAELTDLIHAAYAQRASNNLRYWGTTQSVEDTVHRLQSGQGLIAEIDGRLIGTITVRPPQPESDVAFYRSADTWTLCQFGVLPEFQGIGVGHRLHDAALAFAFSSGGRTMALDTAAPASELIEMYVRWGYSVVGEADWRPQTNYLSVVMSRTIPIRNFDHASQMKSTGTTKPR